MLDPMGKESAMEGLDRLLTAVDRFFELQEAPDVALSVDLLPDGMFRIWAVDNRGANFARSYTAEMVAQVYPAFFKWELERAVREAVTLVPLDRDVRAYWVWYAERQAARLRHAEEAPRLQHELGQRP
jgi:hypothetical protein